MKIVLCTFIGIILAFAFIILILYLWIRSILNKTGFRGKIIKSIYETSRQIEKEEKFKNKEVSGLTNVLLPIIKKDFKNFNEKEMFLYNEKCIRKILEMQTKRNEDLLNDSEFSLIKNRFVSLVRELNKNNEEKIYENVIFHKSAIKEYIKDEAKASLKIICSIEYKLKEKQNDIEIKVEENNYKKQVRIETEYVYVYDAKKAGFDLKTFGLNCPNCGSPLNGLGNNVCSYCKSGINIAILDFTKCWKIVNIKEEY